MKKKGMLGEQVNWIYVLIAGSVIIAFFATIGIRQKNEMEKSRAEEELKTIDELMFQPSRSSQLVRLPGIDLKVNCDSGKTYIKIGQTSPLEPTEPVFSPKSIKSNEIIAMTNEWNVPFKASNFIYLTANDTRYVVLYNDADTRNVAEQIYRELPEQSNKAIQDASRPIQTKNANRVVVIGAGIQPAAPQPRPKELIQIQVIPETSDLEEGKIIFQPNNEIQYTGKAMMVAAIYSGNKKDFECSMMKAYQRMNSVSAIYSIKAEQLAKTFENDEKCKDKYGIAQIDKLKKQNIGIEELKEAKAALDQQNRDALLQSCPTIY
ncbi:hypothetical protein HYU11_00835 [Candidatus Woesearchaeota archaeon]|nr:hypothetical protein [Candidatus Woesearchaeota archaeon]